MTSELIPTSTHSLVTSELIPTSTHSIVTSELIPTSTHSIETSELIPTCTCLAISFLVVSLLFCNSNEILLFASRRLTVKLWRLFKYRI